LPRIVELPARVDARSGGLYSSSRLPWGGLAGNTFLLTEHNVKFRWTIVVLGVALVAPLLSANQSQPPQPAQPANPQLPRSQVPDLGRPTKMGDEMTAFNFDDYFIGKWTFDWDVPEGVLGPAGTLTGSVVYRAIEGPFFEALTTGKGPGGTFTVKELIAYRKEGKTLARSVTDSRGYSYLQLAAVGGDLGGYFNLYYESPPFTLKGKTVRIKNALRLVSPVRYRNNLTVSTDGGPFVTYGNPWFEKDTAGSTTKP
jgi:hypothetical protein